ncbi:MAG: S1-like domain-containing RNA-binding protein [Tissierellia bacterium]|nr:S1-like domain-containing RNA-binding protein [Tissierellia bacterium]
MYDLGKKQKLFIKRFASIGAFLSSSMEDDTDVLIPKKYLKKDLNIGDKIEVFVYKDNENRPIATTQIPKIELGKLAILQVKALTKIGAFLDWGLDKDLLLPFEEQVGKIKQNSFHLVGLYLDKSNRFSATMKVNDYFDKNPPYKENDWVRGTIYSYNSEVGAFIIIDGKYNALLPQKEIAGVLKVGDEISLRVKQVKEDGKLDLSYMNRAHEEMNKDAEIVYNTIKENNGFLRLNDKSDPKLIFSIFKMSKSQFKRAVGRLYKQRKIVFRDNGIMINKGDRFGK